MLFCSNVVLHCPCLCVYARNSTSEDTKDASSMQKRSHLSQNRTSEMIEVCDAFVCSSLRTICIFGAQLQHLAPGRSYGSSFARYKERHQQILEAFTTTVLCPGLLVGVILTIYTPWTARRRNEAGCKKGVFIVLNFNMRLFTCHLFSIINFHCAADRT